MNPLDSILADYENLIREGTPELRRERNRDIKRLKDSFGTMKWICEHLIAVGQPNPRVLCGYCNRWPHEPFCPVDAARTVVGKLK